MFIIAGTNDIGLNYSDEKFLGLHQQILDKLKPSRLYLFSMPSRNDSTSCRVPILNAKIKLVAERNGGTYIDRYLFTFCRSTRPLQIGVSNDGYHLLGPNYLCITDLLKMYVNN